MTKREVIRALKQMGYSWTTSQACAVLDGPSGAVIWPPISFWRHPVPERFEMMFDLPRHPTLWLADNDLTGDELHAGKGMYFEDPITAAVWLKTEASVSK